MAARHRSQHRHTWYRSRSGDKRGVEFDEELHSDAVGEEHPEAALLRAADRERVRRAVDALPLEFREVIILRELQGFSYQEIAQIAEVPVGTVMSRLSRGYPLIGGRLDYVADRAVAALVYGRRQHVISVFLWPTQPGPTGGPAAVTRQGYHMLHWAAPDYAYWVVSDLGVTELREFSQLLQEADRAARVPPAPPAQQMRPR